MEEKRRRRRRKRRQAPAMTPVIVMTAVILLAVIAAVSLVAVHGFPVPVQAWIDIQPDRNAVDGRLRAEDGIQMDGSQYWVVLNQLPTIQTGSRICNLEFENPKENQYSSRVSLYLESSGKRIGGTRRVDPGKYVEHIKLSQTLSAGEHPALVKIELFTGTEPAGELTLEITIRVVENQA